RTADVQGVETDIEGDAFRAQRLDQSFASQAEVIWFEPETQLVIARRMVACTVDEWKQVRYALKKVNQQAHIASAMRVAGVELVKLRQEDGCLEFGKRADVVATVQPTAGAMMDVRVPGQQSPTAPCGEQLGAAKTENAGVAPCAGFAALNCGARRLG